MLSLPAIIRLASQGSAEALSGSPKGVQASGSSALGVKGGRRRVLYLQIQGLGG